MNGTGINRIARQIAPAARSRRNALRTGGLGMVAAMMRLGLPGAAAALGENARLSDEVLTTVGTPTACPASADGGLAIDGAWLCRQPYALCTTAPCARSSDDASVASCRCVVLDGYSIGYTSCPERELTGTTLISTFSTQNVTSAFGILTCPEETPWANCLDMPCKLDPLDPALALCQCQVVETGPSFTFGGGCDADTCSSVLWSATAPPGVTQYAAAMACVNQPPTFPATCPNVTTASSPVATPGLT